MSSIPLEVLKGRCRLRAGEHDLQDCEAEYRCEEAKLVVRVRGMHPDAAAIFEMEGHQIDRGLFEHRMPNEQHEDEDRRYRLRRTDDVLCISRAIRSGPGGKPVTEFEFVSNSSIVFDVDESGDESIFSGGPGRDIKDVREAGFGWIEAVRGRVRLSGDRWEDQNHRIALSVAAGGLLRPFAAHRGNTIEYTGNQLSVGPTGTPLFFAGHPRINCWLLKNGFAEAYECAFAKLQGMAVAESEQARNAISVYLDGRALAATSPVLLLTSFHFLEYMVKPKKFAKEQLAPLLHVSIAEAGCIVVLRNDVVHNNQSLEGSVRKFFDALEARDSVMVREMRRTSPESDAVSYVISMCDRALLRWIGYDGLPQHRLATDEGALRRSLGTTE